MGINNSLTDTWMWKLGLRPWYSFSGNICFKKIVSNFRHFVFAVLEGWEDYEKYRKEKELLKSRGSIFKLLRSTGIDSEVSFRPAYVAGGPVRHNPVPTRFLAPMDVLKFQHRVVEEEQKRWTKRKGGKTDRMDRRKKMKAENHQKEKEKTEQDTERDKEEERIFNRKQLWEGRKKARKGRKGSWKKKKEMEENMLKRSECGVYGTEKAESERI
jgi:hypothetical protein